jgi:phage gp36-like protein
MYITISDLGIPEEVLVRLTDDEGAGSVNSDRAQSAISAAQAVIDCALSRQYAVPFVDPPDVVRKLTSDLAVYNLYQRMGSVPQEVRAAYDNVSAVLDKIAQGLFSIGPPGPGAGFSCQPREFSRSRMEGF